MEKLEVDSEKHEQIERIKSVSTFINNFEIALIHPDKEFLNCNVLQDWGVQDGQSIKTTILDKKYGCTK